MIDLQKDNQHIYFIDNLDQIKGSKKEADEINEDDDEENEEKDVFKGKGKHFEEKFAT